MNVYDFDKTIYDGDSTADFYIFSLKRHKKFYCLPPHLSVLFLNSMFLKSAQKRSLKKKCINF